MILEAALAILACALTFGGYVGGGECLCVVNAHEFLFLSEILIVYIVMINMDE